MLAAIPKKEFSYFLNSIKVYLYFYGGIYVAVRGLETMKKFYIENLILNRGKRIVGMGLRVFCLEFCL